MCVYVCVCVCVGGGEWVSGCMCVGGWVYVCVGVWVQLLLPIFQKMFFALRASTMAGRTGQRHIYNTKPLGKLENNKNINEKL